MTFVQLYDDANSHVDVYIRVYDVKHNTLLNNADWSPTINMVCIGYSE